MSFESRSRSVSTRISLLHHKEEAQIVAEAGQPGKITIATNMAGRGTDIRLGSGIASLGGLPVIATEWHESHRIDQQLFGRSARQGDPGSAQAFRQRAAVLRMDTWLDDDISLAGAQYS